MGLNQLGKDGCFQSKVSQLQSPGQWTHFGAASLLLKFLQMAHQTDQREDPLDRRGSIAQKVGQI